jgi:hypothetical protein
MRINKFSYDLETTLLCSVYREYPRMDFTFITWNYEHLEQSGIPKHLKRENQRKKYEKAHSLSSMFQLFDTINGGINYDKITIWLIPKLNNEYLVNVPNCEYLLHIKDYSYECGCHSCDGTTKSWVTLCPMTINYAIKMEYIHVNDIIDL